MTFRWQMSKCSNIEFILDFFLLKSKKNITQPKKCSGTDYKRACFFQRFLLDSAVTVEYAKLEIFGNSMCRKIFRRVFFILVSGLNSHNGVVVVDQTHYAAANREQPG